MHTKKNRPARKYIASYLSVVVAASTEPVDVYIPLARSPFLSHSFIRIFFHFVHISIMICTRAHWAERMKWKKEKIATCRRVRKRALTKNRIQTKQNKRRYCMCRAFFSLVSGSSKNYKNFPISLIISIKWKLQDWKRKR